jgi:hypothetical protein
VAGVLICKIALGSSLLAKAIAVQKQPRVTRLQGGEALDEFNNQSGDEPHAIDNQLTTVRVNCGSFRVDDLEGCQRAVEPWLQS